MCERQQLVQWVNQNNAYIYDPHCEGLKTTTGIRFATLQGRSQLISSTNSPTTKFMAYLSIHLRYDRNMECGRRYLLLDITFFLYSTSFLHYNSSSKDGDNKLKAFLISGHARQLENSMVSKWCW